MSEWRMFVEERNSEPVRKWSESQEFRGIADRDRACHEYSDGTLHCGEGGDNVAEDRRKLLLYLERVMDSLTV